jgi:hypothetical protein
VLISPVALYVSLALPIQCPLWEVFALSAAFACFLSVLFALASHAYDMAFPCIVSLLEF